MAKSRAHKLFMDLAANLAKSRSDYPGQILCPLCLNPFPVDALQLEEPRLTVEHIIPAELGGRIVTLTCKLCNNTHGAKLDSHLIQKVRSEESVRGISSRPVRGRLGIGPVSVAADIDWKASVGGMTTFRIRRSNPKDMDIMRQLMDEGAAGRANVLLDMQYIPARSDLAVLRIAYLAMFRALGYSYILSPAADLVRNVVLQYESPPPDIGDIVKSVRSMNPPPKEPVDLLRVGGGRAVMVVITLRENVKHQYAVFMPGDLLPPDSAWQTLREIAKSTGKEWPVSVPLPREQD